VTLPGGSHGTTQVVLAITTRETAVSTARRFAALCGMALTTPFVLTAGVALAAEASGAISGTGRARIVTP